MSVKLPFKINPYSKNYIHKITHLKMSLKTFLKALTLAIAGLTSQAQASPIEPRQDRVMYRGRGTVAEGWPSQDQWLSFDEL
jgi:hypothetical protein